MSFLLRPHSQIYIVDIVHVGSVVIPFTHPDYSHVIVVIHVHRLGCHHGGRSAGDSTDHAVIQSYPLYFHIPLMEYLVSYNH